MDKKNYSKEYSEVVELEPLNDLMRSSTHSLVSAVLFYTIQGLNNDEHLKALYHFDIIVYGFSGYYPAIGVEYLIENAPSVEERVISHFDAVVSTISLGEFIKFTKDNHQEIGSFINDLQETNEDYEQRDPWGLRKRPST